MESVSKMLDWIGDNLCGPAVIKSRDYAQICEMAHEIEAEVGRDYVKLPVDADGEIIHVGDMMERGKARGYVIALMLSEYPKKWGGGLHWGVQLEGEQAPTALDLTFHHHRKPTVEYVLRDFGVDIAHALDADPDATVPEAIIAEYAAKLREAMCDD